MRGGRVGRLDPIYSAYVWSDKLRAPKMPGLYAKRSKYTQIAQGMRLTGTERLRVPPMPTSIPSAVSWVGGISVIFLSPLTRAAAVNEQHVMGSILASVKRCSRSAIVTNSGSKTLSIVWENCCGEIFLPVPSLSNRLRCLPREHAHTLKRRDEGLFTFLLPSHRSSCFARLYFFLFNLAPTQFSPLSLIMYEGETRANREAPFFKRSSLRWK